MFLSVLRHMLLERGLRVSEDTAAEFYEYMMKAAPWFPQEGTLTLPDWKRLGKDLKRYATVHEDTPVPKQMFPIWLQIRDALTEKSDLELLAEEVMSLEEGQPLIDSEGENRYGTVLGKEEKGKHPTAPLYTEVFDDWDDLAEEEQEYNDQHYPDERDHEVVAMVPLPRKSKQPPVPKPRRKLLPPVGFQAAVQEARRTGDLTFSFPVVALDFNEDGGEAEWEPLALKTIKELQAAVKASGPSAPFTLQLVDLVASQWLTPSDWHQTARSVLSPGDYVLWRTDYEERCKDSVKKSISGRRGKSPTMDMMLGTGDFIKQQAQVKIPKQVLKEITTNAVLAWRAIPPAGTTGTALAGIQQSLEEPYQSFIARLEEAINRMMPQSEGTAILLKQLAWENANQLCRDLIRPIRRTGSLQDYIRACADASPAVVQGMAYAAAMHRTPITKFIKTTYGGGRSDKDLNCFGCGKPGHKRAACPNKGQNRESASKGVAPGICPRCNKGRHWKNECRSKFHKDGTTLKETETKN